LGRGQDRCARRHPAQSRAADANGDATTFSYDSLNRLTGVVYADATSVTYAYDAVGNRTTMTGPTGSTTYTYDSLDRPLSVNSPQGLVSYTYDALNRLTTATPAGTTTSVYDSANRLISVTDWNGNATTYTYDAAGRPPDHLVRSRALQWASRHSQIFLTGMLVAETPHFFSSYRTHLP